MTAWRRFYDYAVGGFQQTAMRWCGNPWVLDSDLAPEFVAAFHLDPRYPIAVARNTTWNEVLTYLRTYLPTYLRTCSLRSHSLME